jgi:hypothetical protein
MSPRAATTATIACAARCVAGRAETAPNALGKNHLAHLVALVPREATCLAFSFLGRRDDWRSDVRALPRKTPDAMSAVAHVAPARSVRALAPSRGAARRRAGVVVRAAAKPKPKSKDGTAASTERKPKVAIVGAGWGGFGAAKALCEAGCDVTLLDGIPDPTGMTPSTTPTGKPFEYGTRGFWKDYPNIEATLAELGVRESDVFSDFTASSFFSPDGLEATAPVFSSSDYPQLPSPFGQVFATFDNFKRLPLEDRVTMVGLLYAMLDLGRDDETFEAYDRMTAHDLFITFGLSKRLVDDFIRPTLLVGLFKPPEELSAAVTMELLYYYALAHQDSFDVRWIAKGTVASSLIAPLAERLVTKYGLKVLGGCRVEEVVGGRGHGPGHRAQVREERGRREEAEELQARGRRRGRARAGREGHARCGGVLARARARRARALARGVAGGH